MFSDTSSRATTATALDARSIRVAGLRRFFGPTAALDGIDLEVRRGSVTALLGPNAAGKTTLLRVLATLERPDSGFALVEGDDVVAAADRVRRRIGIVAHLPLLYPDLTVDENLSFFARLYGLGESERRRRGVIAAAGLSSRRHDRLRTLSRGQVQRLAIARAVLHEPSVLLLDEPHSGLDPLAAGELDGVLSGVSEAGRTVLFSTHDVRRALSLAEELAVVREGRVVWSGRSDELSPAELGELLAAPWDEVGGRSLQAETYVAESRPRSMIEQTALDLPSEAATSIPAAAWAILWKDLTIELRSGQILAPVIVFGALVIVLMHFALQLEPGLQLAVAPGTLWVAILFGSVLGLSRSLGSELEGGGMTGLLVSPADRGALFLGKWLASYVFTSLVACVLLAAMVVLFSLPPVDVPRLAGSFALGLAGWVAAGTLMSGMAVSTRAREVLLPVILFPLVLPLIVPAVGAAAIAFGLSPDLDLGSAVALMAAFSITYMVLGFLFFSHVVEG